MFVFVLLCSHLSDDVPTSPSKLCRPQLQLPSPWEGRSEATGEGSLVLSLSRYDCDLQEALPEPSARPSQREGDLK